jgi:hypothetical protein
MDCCRLRIAGGNRPVPREANDVLSSYDPVPREALVEDVSSSDGDDMSSYGFADVSSSYDGGKGPVPHEALVEDISI